MIKSDLNDLKNNIVNEDGWGSYFIYDNFLDDKMFRSLCDDFNEIKTSSGKNEWWSDSFLTFELHRSPPQSLSLQ